MNWRTYLQDVAAGIAISAFILAALWLLVGLTIGETALVVSPA